MRTQAENAALRRKRIFLAPVGLLGLGCIWIYVRFTSGKEQANDTISEILDL